MLQRLREAERELLFQEFAQHEGDIMSGIVETSDPGRAITLDLGRAQAVLPYDEQVSTERYRKGQRVKVFVLSVRSGPKGPEILVSRSHRNVLRRCSNEVPSTTASGNQGHRPRSRLRRRSQCRQTPVSTVGSCIGIRGNRIQSIVNELQGEKIDIVSWDSDHRSFIANSLSPSEPVQVELLEAEQTAVVVVPDRQLSLAIGKEGQNTRLAARLTGWRLDIKGMTEWEEIREARLQAAAEAAAEAAARAAEEAAARAEAAALSDLEAEEAEMADAVAEAEAIVEEAAAETPVSEDAIVAAEATDPVEAAVEEVVPEPVVSELDDESLLEALILEEEEQSQQDGDDSAETEDDALSLSVEDLDSFTLAEIAVVDDDEEDEVDDEPLDFSEMPVLTPDAARRSPGYRRRHARRPPRRAAAAGAGAPAGAISRLAASVRGRTANCPERHMPERLALPAVARSPSGNWFGWPVLPRARCPLTPLARRPDAVPMSAALNAGNRPWVAADWPAAWAGLSREMTWPPSAPIPRKFSGLSADRQFSEMGPPM